MIEEWGCFTKRKLAVQFAREYAPEFSECSKALLCKERVLSLVANLYV